VQSFLNTKPANASIFLAVEGVMTPQSKATLEVKMQLLLIPETIVNFIGTTVLIKDLKTASV
jgi:hypothetical protein